MRTYGTLESDLEGINEYRASVETPQEFRIVSFIRPIVDQGVEGACSSVAITDLIHYQNKFKGLEDDKIKFNTLYRLRKNKRIEGMTVREAIEIYNDRYRKLTYAKVGSLKTIKAAILTNGPVCIALPVKSTKADFWKGSSKLGGHAVVLIGWTRDSFILKNSWGTSYADNGYIDFPFTDIGSIYECWTII